MQGGQPKIARAKRVCVHSFINGEICWQRDYNEEKKIYGRYSLEYQLSRQLAQIIDLFARQSITQFFHWMCL